MGFAKQRRELTQFSKGYEATFHWVLPNGGYNRVSGGHQSEKRVFLQDSAGLHLERGRFSRVMSLNVSGGSKSEAEACHFRPVPFEVRQLILCGAGFNRSPMWLQAGVYLLQSNVGAPAWRLLSAQVASHLGAELAHTSFISLFKQRQVKSGWGCDLI